MTDAERAVIQAFLAKYDELWPDVGGLFAFAAIHGWAWPVGKNWATELQALRDLVAKRP